MFIHEMKPLADNALMQRAWPTVTHGDGRYLGQIKTYNALDADFVTHSYDVWIVDNEDTLLLQFGEFDGVCLTLPTSTMAVVVNNRAGRAELWAYAYHMYLKSKQGDD